MYLRASRPSQWICCSLSFGFRLFVLFPLVALAADTEASGTPGSEDVHVGATIICQNRVPLPPDVYFPINIPRYTFRDLSNFCYTHTFHNGGCHCVRNTNPEIRFSGGEWVVDCSTAAGGNSDLVWSRAIAGCYMNCFCEPPAASQKPSTDILSTFARQSLLQGLRLAKNYCTITEISGSVAERDDQKGAEVPADSLCPDGYGCKRVVSHAPLLMWGVGDAFPLGLCGPK